jgi:hypothetical protein
MAKIKINNLNRENQMVDLDEKQIFNILGGSGNSWHIYHAPNGDVIRREWENDGRNIVVHHRP